MLRALIALSCFTAASALRATVLGGTGYVGSRVVEQLVAKGHQVRSVSASGKAPSAPWAAGVEWVANDLTRGPREALEEAVGAPDVCISCVGSVGFDGRGLELGNGVANVRAAEALAKQGLQKYVYVSVASEVADAAGILPGYFDFYFAGKKTAEAAIEAAAPGNARFVKPSFIYGGDEFGLFPPRVNGAYGSAVEEVLSGGIFKALGDLLPGLLGVAFRPPVSVDAVAAACVAQALGECADPVLDGTAAINKAAGAAPATGFSDFVASVSSAASDAAAATSK